MKNLFESANLLKYTTTLMILSVLLLPKFPFISVPGTFVSIRVEDVAVFATAIVFAIHFMKDRQEILNQRVTKYAAVYIVVGFVSLISAVFITQTIAPHIGLLHWIRRIQYLIPMFIGIYLVRKDRDNIDYFIKIFVIVTLYVLVYGLGQRYLGWPIIITQNLEYSKGVALRWIEGSHINSTFAGHYDLAAFLVLILPIIVGAAVAAKSLKSKMLLIFTFLGGLWLMGFAASRISIVAYLIAVSGSLLLSKRYKLIPIVLIVSIFVFALSPNLRSRYDRFFTVLRGQISVHTQDILVAHAAEIIPNKRASATPTPAPAEVFEDRSTSIRLKAAWPKAFRAVGKNPILGTGYSSVTLAVDNNYLRILGEVGIIGFAGWLILFTSVARSFVDAFPFTKKFKSLELVYVSSIASSFLAVFVIALFIDIYLASKFALLFWFCIGLALGLIKDEGCEI